MDKPKDNDEQPMIQDMGDRMTSFGKVAYICVYTPNYRLLSWREIWDCFSEAYPGQWAIQIFPPSTDLVDEVNKYHLFVLGEKPEGFAIGRMFAQDKKGLAMQEDLVCGEDPNWHIG